VIVNWKKVDIGIQFDGIDEYELNVGIDYTNKNIFCSVLSNVIEEKRTAKSQRNCIIIATYILNN
jgi:hypothetical protein